MTTSVPGELSKNSIEDLAPASTERNFTANSTHQLERDKNDTKVQGVRVSDEEVQEDRQLANTARKVVDALESSTFDIRDRISHFFMPSEVKKQAYIGEQESIKASYVGVSLRKAIPDISRDDRGGPLETSGRFVFSKSSEVPV
uniref:Uncharacterized protein n=1 Tax=Peronospora matthiolae TaxID=2874970 RepID=A0AAV1TQ00_9STRA